MPEFTSLQQQIKYFNVELKNKFGDFYNTKKALIKIFPFNNITSLNHILKQKDEQPPSGRPSYLTDEEKEMIAQTAYNNFAIGNPLRVQDLYAKVNLEIKSDQVTLQYFSKFISNNQHVFEIYKTETIERHRSVIPENEISRYFQQLKNSISGISPKLICNLDEIGFGDMQQSDCVFVVGKPNVEKNDIPKYPVPPSINRITALVTIFLDGTTTPPLVIVPTSTVQKSAFHYLENCVDGIIEHQDNGYMNNELFQLYLERILIPTIDYKKKMYPELINMKPVVILDGCSSHRVEMLREKGIVPVFLPPHSSHILQPCDASLFSSIKKQYRENMCKIEIPEIIEKFDNLSRVSASIVSVILAEKKLLLNQR